MSTQHAKIVVGITGASGAVYAVRLLQVLVAAGREVQLSISPSGATVIRQELGLTVDLDDFQIDALLPNAEWLVGDKKYATLRSLIGDRAIEDVATNGRVHYFHHQNLMAPMASGSSLSDGMVICPCSGGTLSAVAHAASGNLIQRAAEVHLKERRKLILVPRETPLSLPQLDNMRRVTEAGAVVLPAMPGFYHGVRGVSDLVDFVVARICDQLGVEHQLMKRWGEE
jgi:4-hydroxy-3-polyprenylbenzoate decarboxylase